MFWMRPVFSGPISVKKRRMWVQPSSFHTDSTHISRSASPLKVLIEFQSRIYQCTPKTSLTLNFRSKEEGSSPNVRTKIPSGFGKIVTKDEAVLAVDEHASFVVDDFVDAKESSRVCKAGAVHEVDGRLSFENKGINFI